MSHGMKITDIKTFLVGGGGRNWVYVKILTDQGIYGIGEAYSAGPDEAIVSGRFAFVATGA